MMIYQKLRLLGLNLLFIVSICFIFPAQAIAKKESIPGQVSIEILNPPTPLRAEGKDYLVYELHLVNYNFAEIKLQSLEVSDGEKKRIFKFNKDNLAALIHPVGNKNSGDDSLIISPGMAKMIFMWLPFESKEMIPKHLIHTITFNTKRENKNLKLTTVTEPMLIKHTDPLVLTPPLQGDHWVAGGGPSNTSYHRSANMVFNGRDYFAQRFAIDFIKIGDEGLSYQGNENKNENYFAYGENVLAVAPGKVVEVKDGIPENTPHTDKTAVPINLDTVGGNHVVIQLDDDVFAFYAHLIPGSIKVKKGDKISKGELIGKVGNSGNSSEPHLHFHVVDNPSFLGANGLPYAFDSFYIRPSKLLRQDPSLKIEITSDELQHQLKQLVLENTVLKFVSNKD